MFLSEYPFETKPFQHQLEGLKFAIQKHGKALFYCEPGTGKTYIAVNFAGFMFMAEKGDLIFVTAPLAGLGQWEKQIKLHLSKSIPVDIVRLPSSSKKKIEMLRSLQARLTRQKFIGAPRKLTFVLMNYGSFHRKNLVAQLLRMAFDVACADECHRIGNPNTAQSKALWRIGQTAKYRLGLSGTPLRKSPVDFFGQVRFIDAMIFTKKDEGTGRTVPMTWSDFKKEYAIQDNPNLPGLITGVRNVEDIYAKVKSIAFIRRKDQCLDLPPKTHEIISIPLTGRSLDDYISMSEEMVAEIDKNAQLLSDLRAGLTTDLTRDLTDKEKRQTYFNIARSLVSKMTKLRQLACGINVGLTEDGSDKKTFITGHDKLKAVIDIAEDVIANNRQVVIVTVFRPDIARYIDACKKKKWTYGTIYGDITGAKRDQMIDAFQAGKLQVMIVQIQAGSEAMDLFAASDMIFAAVDWSHTNMTQVEDRIHRQGQTSPCTYYFVIAEHTIEEDILETLAAKQDFDDQFMQRPQHLAGRIRTTIAKLKELRSQPHDD